MGAAIATANGTDWVVIGLVLAVLGSILLGNAILFRHPRALVEEYFGSKSVRLPAIREYVFSRAQVAVGFTYLVGGFGVQIFGRYQPERYGGDVSAPAVLEREFPLAWVGAIVVLTIALLGLSWWWAKRSFRRHVRKHLRRELPDFEADLRLAREVGNLFGIVSLADDTVQSYLERLHVALEMPAPERRGQREIPLARPDEMEAEEG